MYHATVFFTPCTCTRDKVIGLSVVCLSVVVGLMPRWPCIPQIAACTYSVYDKRCKGSSIDMCGRVCALKSSSTRCYSRNVVTNYGGGLIRGIKLPLQELEPKIGRGLNRNGVGA